MGNACKSAARVDGTEPIAYDCTNTMQLQLLLPGWQALVRRQQQHQVSGLPICQTTAALQHHQVPHTPHATQPTGAAPICNTNVTSRALSCHTRHSGSKVNGSCRRCCRHLGPANCVCCFQCMCCAWHSLHHNEAQCRIGNVHHTLTAILKNVPSTCQ
jgi:hypothetical protein